MDRHTQLALLDRVMAHRAAGRGTDVSASTYACPVTDYTSPARAAAERDLIHRAPALVGLSGLVGEPGTFATVRIADRSVIVTRSRQGKVSAMLNVCRHRGAEVTDGRGAASRLRCPYHGWTYDLDGSLASIRRAEYFDDCDVGGLTPLPVVERHGTIWACAEPDAVIPDDPLFGAARELAPFGLEAYHLFDSTSFTRPINWKLAVDTFCESYHLSSLHRETLAPMIHDDYSVFDAFGPHGRMISTRTSISELDGLDRDRWSLFPHATILWYLVPNTVLIYQQDHVQLYQARPGDHPGEAHLDVTLYVPAESARSDDHWRRNFELLVNVTDTEDFTIAASQQRGFSSPAQDHLVFGRNEPALQHYHRSIDAALDPSG